MNNQVIRKLLWVRGLRALADGYVSLLLPIYLVSLGMTPFQVGAIATATLLGSGLLTMMVGLYAWRFNYRTLLLIAAALMLSTGIGFCALNDFWPLIVIAFVGTLNPSNGDVSVFLPLEHAVLSMSTANTDRTAVFAKYSLVGALLAAAGAFLVAVPDLLASNLHVPLKYGLQAMFALYGGVGLTTAIIYAGLPEERDTHHKTPAPLGKSKSAVYKLAALFSIDAFGGGFVVQSMVALWLFQRFRMPVATAGVIFFLTGLLSAASYLAAVRISNKIGLINTMVFTHLPASLCLIAIPFLPDLNWVVCLLLIRGCLSQMDVPTRGSYVMAIVPSEERAAAAAITSVPRSLAASIGPFIAGYLLSKSSFGYPLVAAGGLKVLYDVLLLWKFRSIKPPEELKA